MKSVNNSMNIYRRPLVVVLGMRALLAIERRLPAAWYGVIRDLLFSVYRLLIRLLYLRRWFWSVMIGDVRTRRKVELVFRVMPYSLVGWRGLEATYDAVQNAQKNNVSGNLVECGVAQGGSAALMALVASQTDHARVLWLFDSYEGLPDPTENDFEAGQTGLHIRPLPKGSCLGTYEQVEKLLFGKLHLDRKTIVMVKGWFQDTLPAKRHEIGNIAVLRIDGDWYESTKCCLENLYNNVVAGGYVIIDDYFSCFGARKAVDEFVSSWNAEVELFPDRRGGCYFVKPASHTVLHG